MTIPARLQEADQIIMSPDIYWANLSVPSMPFYPVTFLAGLDGDIFLIYTMCDKAARILAEFDMLKDHSSASAAFNKAGGSEMLKRVRVGKCEVSLTRCRAVQPNASAAATSVP